MKKDALRKLSVIALLLAVGAALLWRLPALRGRAVAVPGAADDALPAAFSPTAPGTGPAAALPPPGPRPDMASMDFTPVTRPLVEALEAGRPLRLRIGGRARELLLSPAPFLADTFRVTVGGQVADAMACSVRLFAGLTPATRFAVARAGNADAQARLKFEPFADVVFSVVNGAAALEITEPDGQYTQARLDPRDGQWRAVEWRTDDFAFRCGYETASDGATLAALRMTRHPQPGDWERRAVAATVDPEPATEALGDAPGDRDPSSGQFSLSQDRVPWGPLYEATLKKVQFIWAVNKYNTGANTPQNLAYQASFYLAFFAHSAATYEYQMGFRNLLQELILVPDDPAYEDFGNSGSAGTKLDNFRVYINNRRPQGTYGWQTACGAPNYIWAGLAWLPVFPGSYSVNISDPWHYVVNMHEHGHNFGTGHTQGGIMNPYVSDSWDFHTLREGSTTRTSAHEMYDWCLNRGSDTGLLRSPYDMPFAQHDAKATALNTPISFDPRTNDFTRTTARTNDNELTIEEVSALRPRGAGTVSFTATNVTFVPANGYQGVAWFSYSLRGTVGNSGQGYLHRATVAITVGADTRQPYAVSVPAGQAVEFVPGIRPNGIVTQPAQAVATVAVGGYSGWFYELGVRARPDAAGTDQFVFSSSSGNKTVDVTYTAAPGLQVHDDYLPDNTYSGGLRLAPLANDEGAGERSTVIDTRIRLGDQADATPGAVQDFFDDHFGLYARTDLDPAKGTSVVDRATLYADTGAVSTNSGYLVFHRLQTGGVARIDYEAGDSFGAVATGRVHVILPMVTLDSPTDNPGSSSSVHEESMLVLDATTYPSADFPLTGSPSVRWSRFSGPGAILFGDETAVDTTASFGPPGSYAVRATATDNGYATWRQARVTVRGAAELPVAENLGGYAVRKGLVPVTTTDNYNLGNLIQSVVDDGKSGLPFSVRWSQISGPGAALFADPTVAATTVLLPVKGSYVLRLSMDDGRIKTAQDFGLLYDADTDGDGLPDAWEMHFFGNLTRGAAENPADGDAQNLLQEFVAGSDPTDSNRLDFASVTAASNGTVSLAWNSRQAGPGPARLYQLQDATSYYVASPAWSSTRQNLSASGNTTTHTLNWYGTNRAMRLFRAIVAGATTTRTDRVAGVLRVPLVVGQNYVSMPLAAAGATIADILPPALLPGATTETAAPTVAFWNTASQSLTSPLWLSSHPSYPGWRASGSVNDANGTTVDAAQGMVITLRSAQGNRTLFLAGTVPTNAAATVAVKGSGYTLAALPYPSEVTLASSGLLAAGFHGGSSPATSDQLMFFDEATKSFTTRVWYDTSTAQWRDVATVAISTKKLTPGQPVLIRRRVATDFTWTMTRPYPLP